MALMSWAEAYPAAGLLGQFAQLEPLSTLTSWPHPWPTASLANRIYSRIGA
ncbi:hypothetical protein [Amycolatopsis australiensis]|uniref:Uncharacterized protein n=1 Tax=Amycolatopsis australiensis TaxID=546364 RepID=A0A1K1RQY6_9PSEU|nr:hypothetical protein [Amycolatopsis australiensis]SFW74552.1 hypothetical protein SAMN04489730_3788 [Amycolatopsis australiensis]